MSDPYLMEVNLRVHDLSRSPNMILLSGYMTLAGLLTSIAIMSGYTLYNLYWNICIYLMNSINAHIYVNSLRPKQNGRHFADDTFKHIFLNENVGITIKISLKFVHKDPINSMPALVQIMAWRRPGDKPLSEPMVVRLPTNICITWPQWVE